MPIEYDFPVTEYYKHHILYGQTLTHTGVWWTAILLIDEPKSHHPFIGFYRWQKTEKGWKTRKRFTFKRQSEINQALKIIEPLIPRLAP